MKDWNYENEQWTKLPAHLKHLPLFTRHFDMTSMVFRALWGIAMKGIAFRFYVRLKVIGDFHKIYREHKRLILISNHSSHLDAVSIAAAVPFRYWLDLYITTTGFEIRCLRTSRSTAWAPFPSIAKTAKAKPLNFALPFWKAWIEFG
jgi:hypothetical protein